jgi:hypothetical protein
MATRLSKRARRRSAVVVAAVALERLGLADRAEHVLAVDRLVPQVAQGALAVECRADDVAVNALVRVIEHAGSRRRVDAERDLPRRAGWRLRPARRGPRRARPRPGRGAPSPSPACWPRPASPAAHLVNATPPPVPTRSPSADSP